MSIIDDFGSLSAELARIENEKVISRICKQVADDIIVTDTGDITEARNEFHKVYGWGYVGPDADMTCWGDKKKPDAINLTAEEAARVLIDAWTITYADKPFQGW